MTNPHFQLYIDGSFCEGAGGVVMHSQNPARPEATCPMHAPHQAPDSLDLYLSYTAHFS